MQAAKLGDRARDDIKGDYLRTVRDPRPHAVEIVAQWRHRVNPNAFDYPYSFVEILLGAAEDVATSTIRQSGPANRTVRVPTGIYGDVTVSAQGGP